MDFVVSDSLSFSSTDPKITLDYDVTDDVMIYGTYAEGFKSGGVQYAVYDPASANSSFDEERLRLVEIGLKSRFFDDRVQFNSAVYQYDYQNQQVQSIVAIGGAPQALTQNAGDSTLTGIETEFVALLAEGLTVTANYTYQRHLRPLRIPDRQPRRKPPSAHT
jgi:iron complex outermembrane receptor protein